MKNNYICKIASLEEMEIKWNYEIEHNMAEQNNWSVWKEKNLEQYQEGSIIPYYGILDGTIICEATAMINPETVQNSDGLVGDHAAYLSAFRTIENYQGKGFFSKLMKFMLSDLKQRGFHKAALGVEPADEKNKKIYEHYGFTEYIKSAAETYPDGTVIDVDYYGKWLIGSGFFNHMALTDYLAAELVGGLRRIFDGNVQQIILFGSAARMEAVPESDIDIAVILRQKISPDKREEFLEWSAEFDMKHEKVFSFIDIEKEKIDQWGEILPFYKNIQKEGIVLWKTA